MKGTHLARRTRARTVRTAAGNLDAFVSHSSENRAIATRVASALEDACLSIWLDDTDIHLGALLRQELRASIRRCRVLLLLWSKPAAASRWINAEWLMAYHVGKFIIPCTLDEEPLPHCLQPSVFLSLKRFQLAVVRRLAQAIAEARSSPNPLLGAMRSEAPELREVIHKINRGQQAMIDQLAKRKLAKAMEILRLLDAAMTHALQVWPLDPMIVNLSGYHLKNAYMVKHWDAIQAGRGPQDELLSHAERRFFEALSIDPTDPSALNGLGSILILERELDAAEFFIRTAIAATKKRGMASYPAAEQDLRLVLHYKRKTP